MEKDEEGRLIKEPEGIAALLWVQYDEVFSTPSEENIILSPRDFFAHDTKSTASLTDINFTETDMTEVIKDIGSNASASLDRFPALLLRNVTELSLPLCVFYRNTLDCGLIPKQLKNAKITPVNKGVSRSEPKNYRPTGLTSHIINVLEKLLVKDY